MKIDSKQLYTMMALLAGGDILNKYTATVKAKPCLACGIEHIHHNDFCSRECCLKYKREAKVMKNLKLRGTCE